MKFLTAFRGAAFLVTATQFAYPVAAQDKGPAKGLAAPTGLWAAQTSPTEITLVWGPVPSAVGFKISSKSGVIATLSKTVTRYVSRFTPGVVPIEWFLEATGEKGLVSQKAAFPVVTPEKGTVTGPVPRPSSVTATETGPGIITLTWTAVSGATAYLLGRTVAPEGLKTLCPMCPTQTEYVDRATTAGARHTYSVQAIMPGGVSQRTMSNVVIPTGGPTPDPDPPEGGADGVPKDPFTQGCTGGERYKTCTSGLYELGATEERKDGSVFCPGGYAALGGGYLGLLNTASVQGSRPLTGDAKGSSGWTVTVARALSQGIGPVKFVVQVVCAPDS